ncbi:MAG: metal ABC transporter permease [Alphaproteobacteria bacterium]
MDDFFLFEPFIIKALLAGIGVALITGVLGCFVVWRRMAYFGDSLAHSALLGIALGIATGINLNAATLMVGASFALLLLWLQRRKLFATDTLLGILAHAALSFGMISLSLQGERINLHGYLFGDILSVGSTALIWIYGCGLFVLLLLWRFWDKLILITLHEDLASAEFTNPFYMQILLMLLMTLVVALSLHIVGILLITSMLIIPAATARQFARSPEQMALLSVIFGVMAVCAGMIASFFLNTPTGPTIVASCASLFILTLPIKLIMQKGF